MIPPMFIQCPEGQCLRCSVALAARMLGVESSGTFPDKAPDVPRGGLVLFALKEESGVSAGFTVACVSCGAVLGIHRSGAFDIARWVHKCGKGAVED